MNHLESAEDYLERILMLKEKKDFVRAIDIANSMNFSKASVSIALKKLKDKKYVIVDEVSGGISLTEEGNEIAMSVYNRHKALTRFFKCIGVNEEVALEDACKVEHDLSEETFSKLCEYVEKMEK